MSPTSLLSVPTDLLRQHADTKRSRLPVAGTADRFWAGVTCLALMTLVSVLFFVLH